MSKYLVGQTIRVNNYISTIDRIYMAGGRFYAALIQESGNRDDIALDVLGLMCARILKAREWNLEDAVRRAGVLWYYRDNGLGERVFTDCKGSSYRANVIDRWLDTGLAQRVKVTVLDD